MSLGVCILSKVTNELPCHSKKIIKKFNRKEAAAYLNTSELIKREERKIVSQLGHVRFVTFGARSGRHNPPAGVRLWQRALILGRQINKFGRVRLLLAASVAPNPNLLRLNFPPK